VLREEEPNPYHHKNAGAVAGLGIGYGVFQSGNVAVTGFLGWIIHRVYHGMAIPMWERKARVFTNWLVNFFWGRDFSSVRRIQRPREFFEEFASRPSETAAKPATSRTKKVAAL